MDGERRWAAGSWDSRSNSRESSKVQATRSRCSAQGEDERSFVVGQVEHAQLARRAAAGLPSAFRDSQ